MSKFGVRELNKILRAKQIALPRNLLPYGFSSPNQRSRLRNLTLQQPEEHRLYGRIATLASEGVALVWLMHLDDSRKPLGSALHETDDPDAVHLFWVPSKLLPQLNATEHQPGVRIKLDELNELELGRNAAWNPAELQQARVDLAASEASETQDDRRRVVAAIVVRQGQAAFRAALISAYRGRCAVTGCDCAEVLEGAHIRPYSGPRSNETQNGLLLRPDVHTLFDLGLLAVDPVNLTVLLAVHVRDSRMVRCMGALLKRFQHRRTTGPIGRPSPNIIVPLD